MVYSKCCTDSRCFTDCHGNRHNSVRCHGFVRSRDTSSCQNQIFHFLRYQTSPGDIISIHILCNSVCLTAAYRIMDIYHELCLMNYNIRKPSRFSQIGNIHYIFSGKTSALTNSQSRSSGFYCTMLISGNILAKEISNNIHLMS